MSDITEFPHDIDRAWKEHGWGLKGWHVAVLVGSILAASIVLRLLG